MLDTMSHRYNDNYKYLPAYYLLVVNVETKNKALLAHAKRTQKPLVFDASGESSYVLFRESKKY